MISLFWNCRGAGKRGRATCFSDIIKDHSLDFVGVQETKKNTFEPKYLRRIDPFGSFQWNWIPSVGKSGGILCGVRSDKLEIIFCVKGKHMLHLVLLDRPSKLKWV